MNNSTGVAGLLAEDRSREKTNNSRQRRLAAPVIEDFVEQIVSGNIPPETNLPSEANICDYLGISRTVLREVLKVLEQKGLVRIENGKGTFITDPINWKLLDPFVLAARLRHDDDRSFLNHLVSVRVALEAEMASEAALEASSHELELMAAKIEELRSSLNDQEKYTRADYEFHELVMSASHNDAGRAIVLAIYHEIQTRSGHVERAELEDSLNGHIAIYEATKNRDPSGAADAARHHITDSWRIRASFPDIQRRTRAR